ncbi:transporter [Prosthecochloris sp. SCSIO W1103]|uniref:transporter n=1 Tax=Prosthecochloris sp. SCSIO W1103 TaxID=2992244 RepID=UPI00223E326C|nr:transporter [Prosthecochloris sp. SCSIO W1103]UZJ37331.1 transporter [Prosthecochloris sp. SCSIO W1103]
MLRTLLLAFMLMLFTLPLYAAHPLITDDTGTQGAGRFQLEINSEFTDDEEDAVDETGGEVATILSYGITDDIDVVLGLPYVWYRVKEDGFTVADADGVGDLTLEVKWRFFEYEDRGLSVALKPAVSFPTGDDEKGLGNGKVSGGGALLVSKEGVLGKLHLNLAYMYNEYGLDEDDMLLRNDIWHASFAGEINVTADMVGVCNIGVETNPEKGMDDHPAFLLGGLIYSVTQNFDIDAGVKWGLNDVETDTTWLAGVALRL